MPCRWPLIIGFHSTIWWLGCNPGRPQNKPHAHGPELQFSEFPFSIDNDLQISGQCVCILSLKYSCSSRLNPTKIDNAERLIRRGITHQNAWFPFWPPWFFVSILKRPVVPRRVRQCSILYSFVACVQYLSYFIGLYICSYKIRMLYFKSSLIDFRTWRNHWEYHILHTTTGTVNRLAASVSLPVNIVWSRPTVNVRFFISDRASIATGHQERMMCGGEIVRTLLIAHSREYTLS